MLKMFAVYDRVGKCYNTPFFLPNADMAVRDFRGAVNNSQTRVSQHPEDYSLDELGSFDEETGEILNLDKNVLLCRAIDHVNPTET